MNNAKWFWTAIGYQTVLAYIVSMCIYQIGTLITTGVFSVGTFTALLFVICFIWLLVRPCGSAKVNLSTSKKLAGRVS